VTTRPPRRRRPSKPGDPTGSITPSAAKTAAVAPPTADGPLGGDDLDAAILRYLRLFPNRFVDLSPLAEQLGIEPFAMQLTVERLGRRRLLNLPFIEPGTANGGELTEAGARWLVRYEGGKPLDRPSALQPATHQTRTPEDAPRLPRDQVYTTR
jgi:hypothetical protein